MSIAAAPQPKANMGKPEPRIDGRAKVTGEARYPADMAFGNAAYAWLVTSAVAKGRIAGFGLDAARAVPGVLDILTHENVDEVREVEFFGDGGHMGSTLRPLQDARIWHDGQIVAVVLAESLEAAREAAYRVEVRYEEERPAGTFGSPGAETADAGEETPQLGDAEAAFAAAEVKLEAEYATPTQHHNPIELFSTTCLWEGGKLIVHEPSQFVWGMKNGLAKQLGLDPDDVRVVSPFVGGAFGSKASLTQRTALVAIAARRLGRPVKLVATREQGYSIASYRAETRHRVRLGASRDGKLAAYLHEGREVTSRTDDYSVAGVEDTARMYGFGAVRTKVEVVRCDRNTPGFMRSPPVVPYMYALESALDELAFELGMDPVELRRVNDIQTDPINGHPYSSRSLIACYDAAAEAFGWARRDPRPGAMREGDWLIGWGCATACYPTHVGPATVRVRFDREGRARVQVAAHDLGTGAYTVIGQMAAEQLGLPLSAVTVELGDSALPPAPVAGGSNTTASVCSAVIEACAAVRRKQAAGSNAAVVEEYVEWRPEETPEDAAAKLYQGKIAFAGGSSGARTMYAFGAEFVEVRVHARTREVRAPRLVGAFAGGRIVNPRTARSQLMGGLIWGLGSALHEATELDERAARYVNDNIAEYLVPVNADVPDVEVILLSEEDPHVNPAGVKGLGELGNVGTAAAVANAVFHATGKRVRELPIRLEKLL